jgi:hypothetical protein
MTNFPSYAGGSLNTSPVYRRVTTISNDVAPFANTANDILTNALSSMECRNDYDLVRESGIESLPNGTLVTSEVLDIDDAIGMFLICGTRQRRTSDNAKIYRLLVFLERLGMGYFQMTILIAAGLCFASDAMEVLLLTFLSIVLQAQWGISDADTSILIGSVFIGAMVGTIVLGALGDRIGRKPIFTITAAMICVFGLATALVDSFPALVLVRVMVGFGVGGLTVPL